MENEQKTDEKVTTTIPTTNSNVGQPSEATSLIEEARKVAERIEKGVAEHKMLLAKEEELRAKDILAGRSSAGYIAPRISEDDKRKEFINEALKGTGIKI